MVLTEGSQKCTTCDDNIRIETSEKYTAGKLRIVGISSGDTLQFCGPECAIRYLEETCEEGNLPYSSSGNTEFPEESPEESGQGANESERSFNPKLRERVKNRYSVTEEQETEM